MEAAQTTSAWPFVSTPERARRALLGPDSTWSGEQLHARLGNESLLVMFQQNPPTWRPPAQVRTPVLWLAAEKDAVISVAGARRSARHYRADFEVVAGAGHNLMMEPTSAATARRIHAWLVSKGLA